MNTDWAFLALTLICAGYMAKIVTEYFRRLGEIRPRITKAEVDCDAWEKQTQAVEGEFQQTRERMLELEREVKSLDEKKSQLTAIHQEKSQKSKRPRLRI